MKLEGLLGLDGVLVGVAIGDPPFSGKSFYLYYWFGSVLAGGRLCIVVRLAV